MQSVDNSAAASGDDNPADVAGSDSEDSMSNMLLSYNALLLCWVLGIVMAGDVLLLILLLLMLLLRLLLMHGDDVMSTPVDAPDVLCVCSVCMLLVKAACES